MRVLDLFSGIGGFSLAARWAGMETAAFCEIDPFCQKVLRKNFPSVPIYDDVRKLTKEQLEKDGVISDERPIELVCGGFPCQSFSLAGKRRGKEDDRYLWPEMFRVIQELRPTWVVGENVVGIIGLALDDVLADLESEGYTCRTFVLPACAVGAIHRRDRVWIVAYSDGKRSKRNFKEKIQREQVLQRSENIGSAEEWARRSTVFEPKLCRSLNGFSRGMDRLRALGNAIVPQVAYQILKVIKEIEEAR